MTKRLAFFILSDPGKQDISSDVFYDLVWKSHCHPFNILLVTNVYSMQCGKLYKGVNTRRQRLSGALVEAGYHSNENHF